MTTAELLALIPLKTHLEFNYWPPSVNNITAVVNGRKVKTKKGRDFTAHVCADIEALRSKFDIPFFEKNVKVYITVYPPDRRRFDIDNMSKGILDSMTAAKIWRDDSQVVKLTIEKGDVIAGGAFDISITEKMDE